MRIPPNPETVRKIIRNTIVAAVLVQAIVLALLIFWNSATGLIFSLLVIQVPFVLLWGGHLALRKYFYFRRFHLRWACSNCGYDVRKSPGKCPECGRFPRVQKPLAFRRIWKKKIASRS
jgi:hypothetical protein